MGKLACGLSISSIKEIFKKRKSLSKLCSNRVAIKKDASRPSAVIIEDRVAVKKESEVIIEDRVAKKKESDMIIEDRVAEKEESEVIIKDRVAKKKDDSGPIFPPEIIIEILTWLPLKSLIHLQLVCKEWQAFIQDHYFVVKHMDHSAVVRYYHNVNPVIPVLVNNAPDYEKFSYVQGCDGLLLITSFLSGKCFLWNPATRRVLELPDPENRSCRYAFFYVPSTTNYRIVSLYLNKEEYGFEVFTPGHSQAWRALKFPDIVKADGPTKRFSVVVSAGAHVHCMLVYDNSQVTVISLDMGTECFTVTPLPRGVFKDWKNVEALDWDGKLAIGDVVGEDLELMVLEDISNKKHRWCENKKKIPLPFIKKKGYGEGDLFPLFAKRGDIWFWLKGEKIFTYTLGTGFCTDIKQSRTFAHEEKLYPYKPSLVTFEGMQPDTKFENIRKGISWK